MLEEMSRSRVLFGSDRMQHVPDADVEDGAVANAPCTRSSIPRGLAYGLMPELADSPQETDSRSGIVMIFNVRLFARARDLGGADHLALDLAERGHCSRPAPAAGRSCIPQLAELEAKCAVAVDAEFANDGHILDGRVEEIALH